MQKPVRLVARQHLQRLGEDAQAEIGISERRIGPIDATGLDGHTTIAS